MELYDDLLKDDYNYEYFERMFDEYINDYDLLKGIKGLSFLNKCLDRYLYLYISRQSDKQ